VSAWSTLPDAVRQTILILVQAGTRENPDDSEVPTNKAGARLED
jgi:hypothetical protein